MASFLTAVLFHLNPLVAPSIPVALEKNDIRRKLPDLSFTKTAQGEQFLQARNAAVLVSVLDDRAGHVGSHVLDPRDRSFRGSV